MELEKQRIFLNGMEFIAEPMSFIFNSYLNTTTETMLQENEFFLGTITSIKDYGVNMKAFSAVLTSMDKSKEAHNTFTVISTGTKFEGLFFNKIEAGTTHQGSLYFNGLKLRLLGDYIHVHPEEAAPSGGGK